MVEELSGLIPDFRSGNFLDEGSLTSNQWYCIATSSSVLENIVSVTALLRTAQRGLEILGKY
jgi:hypothetical protein